MEEIEYFLSYLPGGQDIQAIRVSQIDNLGDQLLDLGCLCGIPRFELAIKLLGYRCHELYLAEDGGSDKLLPFPAPIVLISLIPSKKFR